MRIPPCDVYRSRWPWAWPGDIIRNLSGRRVRAEGAHRKVEVAVPRGAGEGGAGGLHFSGSQGADLQQALEKVPPLPIAELNKGDAVLISSTAGADPSRVTAISLVAGVEPLLTRAPGERVNLDWTLDMNLPQ